MKVIDNKLSRTGYAEFNYSGALIGKWWNGEPLKIFTRNQNERYEDDGFEYLRYEILFEAKLEHKHEYLEFIY